jgi:hypothetical protein
MHFRWRVILPVCGLFLFLTITYQSILANHGLHHGTTRYFWWSSIRLNSDPLNKRSILSRIGPSTTEAREWQEYWPETRWVDAGLMTEFFVVLDLPAFTLTMGIVKGLSRLGVSEVLSLMLSLPLLTLTWFYYVGKLMDHWKGRRSPT